MTGYFGKNTEEVVNIEIARIMRDAYPSWTVHAEIEDIFEDEPKLTPDIVAWVPRTERGFISPVVIEVKFDCNNHEREVIENARDRLEKNIKNSDDIVEISFAILVPDSLKTVAQSELYHEIMQTSDIRFKVFMKDDGQDDSWHRERLLCILEHIGDCVDSLT